MKHLGDVMLAAICGMVIFVSAVYVDGHYSTTNVEQQKQR